METPKFADKKDIFISYRRDRGSDWARYLKTRLEAAGYRVFLDLDNMHSNSFKTQLFHRIEDATDFLLLCTEGALDSNENIRADDWVREEIKHAFEQKKNIVPLLKPQFKWPADLPEALSELPDLQAVNCYAEYDPFDRIVALLDSKKRAVKISQSGAGRVFVGILCACAMAFIGFWMWKDAEKQTEPISVPPGPGATELTGTLEGRDLPEKETKTTENKPSESETVSGGNATNAKPKEAKPEDAEKKNVPEKQSDTEQKDTASATQKTDDATKAKTQSGMSEETKNAEEKGESPKVVPPPKPVKESPKVEPPSEKPPANEPPPNMEQSLFIEIASDKPSLEKIQRLVDAGVDVNIKVEIDGKTYTPLALAKALDNKEIVALLEKAGAKE